MIRAGLLLAAGASRRFGAQDKLLAPLDGRPLVTHAARALRESDLDLLIGVVRSNDVAGLLNGFEIVKPLEVDPLQADSLRAGVGRARALGADSVTIILGDMPFVTTRMIDDVTRMSTDTHPAAAMDGKRPIPPVCFASTFFEKLAALEGDRGAASLLSDALLLEGSAGALQDIDTPDALARAQVSVQT